jgi:hypothetical protein
MKKYGQLKLFEGFNKESVYMEANAFLKAKMTVIAHTHVTAIEGKPFYTVVVFYDEWA